MNNYLIISIIIAGVLWLYSLLNNVRNMFFRVNKGLKPKLSFIDRKIMLINYRKNTPDNDEKFTFFAIMFFGIFIAFSWWVTFPIMLFVSLLRTKLIKKLWLRFVYSKEERIQIALGTIKDNK